MTNAVVTYQDAESVRKDIQNTREAVEAVLPSRIDVDRFLRVVAKAVSENPKLMQCTRLSLLSSIHTAAQLGLEPTGLLGSAYLVPYRRRVEVDGKWQSVMEAQLIPGYRGLIDLARRSGEIEAIEAEVVRARDVFSIVKGTNAQLTHIPFIPDPRAEPEERDRGPIVGAYMKAVLRGGHEQYEWMSFDEIEAVRRRSRAADDGPWVTDYSEMSRKTVVRRGSKYLPLTTDFRRALELDEEAERNAEAPNPELAKPSRAAQMLLDRAQNAPRASLDPVEGPTDPEPMEVSAQDGNGPLDASETPGDDAQQPQPDATAICGVVNDELGVCTRAPDHAGGHRNEQGVWPRGSR